MKVRGIVFVIIIVIFAFLSNSYAQFIEEEKASFFFQVGKSSNVESGDLGVKAKNLVFGGGVSVNCKERFYLGGNFLMSNPDKEMFGVDGIPVTLSSGVIFADFGAGIRLNKFSKFDPYVEGGVGLLRVYQSIEYFYQSYNLGSENYFTQNVGFGFRTFFGEKLFVGPKVVFYNAPGNPRVFLFQVGTVLRD